MLRLSGKYLTWSERDRGVYSSYYGQVRDDWFWLWYPNHKTSYKCGEFDYEISINREGVRDIDHSIDNPDNLLRIVTLGDSYTEGAGAPFEETWFNAMERTLRERGYRVEVLSGGVSGSDVFYAYQLLKHKLLRYGPALVILAINNSDITDFTFRGGMERFKEDGTTLFRKGPWFKGPYRNFHLVRFVSHTLLDHNNELLPREKAAEMTREAKRSILDCLDLFHRLSLERRFELLVVIHPIPSELQYDFYEFDDGFLDALRRKPVRSVDLYDALKEKIDAGNIYEYSWPVNRHFNDKGYALFAGEVVKALMKDGWFEEIVRNHDNKS